MKKKIIILTEKMEKKTNNSEYINAAEDLYNNGQIPLKNLNYFLNVFNLFLLLTY